MIKHKVSVYVKRIAWGTVLGILGIAIALLWWTEGWIWYIDEPVYHRILCSLPLPSSSKYATCGPRPSLGIFYWGADYISTWEQSHLESFYTAELPVLGWDFVDQQSSSYENSICMLFTSEYSVLLLSDRYWLLVEIPDFCNSEQECRVRLAATQDEQSLRDWFGFTD
ncbi:MAG: hypothetical protein K8R89_05290 [Anaerolineae bacterium]|nr:hypothetical protein [Anaerolineae bacterium]